MAAVNARLVASRRFGNALVEVALGDVSGLLDDAFGLRHLVDEKETVSGVTFWVKYGKVVIDREYCELMLTPEDTERLGLRLIGMSHGLEGTEGS